MMLRRLSAASAAILTALLLQATVVAPVTLPVAVSLPVVLVASLGLVAGIPAGISVGFAIGLIADLGSNHPVGVFAIVWMQMSLVCAKVSPMLRSTVARALVAAAAATVGTTASALLLTMTGSAGATLAGSLDDFILVFIGDFMLALAMVPLVASVERMDSLRGSSSAALRDAGVDVTQRRIRAETAGLAGQWR